MNTPRKPRRPRYLVTPGRAQELGITDATRTPVQSRTLLHAIQRGDLEAMEVEGANGTRFYAVDVAALKAWQRRAPGRPKRAPVVGSS